MLTLVTSDSSPYGRKVRVALSILGLGDDDVTRQHADTKDPNDPIRQINPLGKIPALIIEDQSVIFDSRVIIDCLEARYGKGEIIPTEPTERTRILTLAALAEGINDALLLIVYEGRYRQPEQASDVWLDHQFGKVRRGLDAVCQRLDEYTAPSVAAITLACALGYADWRKQLDWRSEYPALVGWLDDFRAAVPGYDLTPPE